MLITVQTLQKEIFEIEFDAEKTVLQLKERIYFERGPEYNVENQKLIYAGIILSDERSINSYNIDESKFIVIILKTGYENCFPKLEGGCFTSSVVSSIPNTEKGEECNKLQDYITTTTEDGPFQVMSVEQTAEIENEAVSINSGSDDAERLSQSVNNSDNINRADSLEFVESNTSILSSRSGELVFSRSSNESDGSESSHSTYSSGDLAGVFSNTSIQSRANANLPLALEGDHTIDYMMEMGFSRENVEKAMKISFNNPERALEYLISGIAEASDSFHTTTAADRDGAHLKYNPGAFYDDKSCANTRESTFISDNGSHVTLNRFNSFNKNSNYQESGYSAVQECGESRVSKFKERTTQLPIGGGALNENTKELNAEGQQDIQCATTIVKTHNLGSGDIENIGLSGGLAPISSNTSISSTGSGVFILSERSNISESSETSHSTFSSDDLAGVFSNTSLKSRSESNLPMSQEYNRTIESIIEMGFSRETVEHAMTACFNNPERAIEFLISGLSDTSEIFDSNVTNEENIRTNIGGINHANVYDEERERLSSTIPDIDLNFSSRDGEYDDDQQSLENHHATLRSVTDENPFEIFRNQPQLLFMRSLMYQNPDALHGALQQIGQTNPALLQLISENQDAFLSMLSQTLEEYADISRPNPRRLTPGRRAQLAAAVRAAAGGDGLHVRSLDTAPGAGGDGMLTHQRPGESGDAGADTVPHVISQLQPDRVAERRAAAADAFLRERAAAAVAVAALTADASDTIHREIYDDAVARGATSSLDNDNLSASALLEGNKNMMFLLTPQDEEAINRLKSLGFSESLALQAYLTCEKNEQLAANFLLSSVLND
ncbi:uncharacterized protein Rad23b_1 [Zeugodacus cucurbitae]|uniref:uncharacterized protein Rad23b_1 n=1 Tax=Zeugodacus cucurbitae TaxID=28588 RepID=UPI0023D958A2|nr:uncharacterized protein Rad23b_1 [Zeugodacus cucurbitae]XP_054085565.1 uncharacterized protein Rad23b_1 [Zeugodacus cucurbitae]